MKDIFRRFQAFTGRGFLLCAVALAVSAFLLPLQNPDVFWHLSAGRHILAERAIARADFLSWSMSGAPWIDFEWLTQLIYYVVFSIGGYSGLFLLKFTLLALTLLVLFATLRLYAAERVFFAASAVWAAALMPNFDLRPENFTLLFFSIELYFLEKFRLNLLNVSERKAALVSAVFFALWANLHAGFIFGLLLAGFYVFGAFTKTILPVIYGHERKESYRSTLFLLKVSLAAFAGTFINANGWDIYIVALKHHSELALLSEYIVEWQSADLANIYQRPYWVLLAVAGAVFLWRALRHRDVPFALIAVFMFYAFESSKYSRNTMFLVLIAVPYIVWLIPERVRNSLRMRAVYVAVLFLALWHMRDCGAWEMIIEKPWPYSSGSQGVVKFLKQNKNELGGLKMFNMWGWGGYMGYELYPDYKVFQDGRYLFHKFLPEFNKAISNNNAWFDFVKRHDFEMIAIERYRQDYPMTITLKTGKRIKLMRPFYLAFLPKNEWAMIYWDSGGLLFVRRDRADKNWLAQKEFSLVRAGDMQAASLKLKEKYVSPQEIGSEVSKALSNLSFTGDSQAYAELVNWHNGLK